MRVTWGNAGWEENVVNEKIAKEMSQQNRMIRKDKKYKRNKDEEARENGVSKGKRIFLFPWPYHN